MVVVGVVVWGRRAASQAQDGVDSSLAGIVTPVHFLQNGEILCWFTKLDDGIHGF